MKHIARKHGICPSILVFGAVLLLAEGGAWAEDSVIVCTGSQSVEYSPGLTFTPQSVAFESYQEATCIGTPEVGSVESFGSGTDVRSCSLLPDIGAEPVTPTYYWGDGTESVLEETSSIVQRALITTVMTLAFEIIEGRFAGGTVTKIVTLLNSDLLGCFSPAGLTEMNGITVITVTPPP